MVLLLSEENSWSQSFNSFIFISVSCPTLIKMSRTMFNVCSLAPISFTSEISKPIPRVLKTHRDIHYNFSDLLYYHVYPPILYMAFNFGLSALVLIISIMPSGFFFMQSRINLLISSFDLPSRNKLFKS
jgi:hypothetical protein